MKKEVKKSAKKEIKTAPKEKPKKKKMSKNARIVTTFVCIFLALVLILGIVLGIVVMVKRAKAIVTVGSVSITEGECRVLASYYKNLHLRDLRRAGYDAVDTEKFWSTEHENGMTQGELLEKSTKNYIALVAAASNLYYTLIESKKLREGDESYIKQRTEAFLARYSNFEELISPYGFDYEDFVGAMTLTYTAEAAYYMVYGSGGEMLKQAGAEYTALLDQYLLDNYTKVKMIFLAKEQVQEPDSSGQLVWRDLNPAEIVERENIAEIFKDAIASGGFLEVTIDEYLSNSENPNDGDIEMGLVGYYFSASEQQTASFAAERPEIVRAAYDMTTGEARYIELEDAHVFLYRDDPTAKAYADEDNPFFADFYKNAAFEFFTEDIEALSSEVEFKDKFYEIDLISLKPNDRYFVTSWQ